MVVAAFGGGDSTPTAIVAAREKTPTLHVGKSLRSFAFIVAEFASWQAPPPMDSKRKNGLGFLKHLLLVAAMNAWAGPRGELLHFRRTRKALPVQTRRASSASCLVARIEDRSQLRTGPENLVKNLRG
jgi:hypothetical protein